jgi:hypothetical protein
MQINYDKAADALYIQLLEGDFQCRAVRVTNDIALVSRPASNSRASRCSAPGKLFKNPEAPQVERAYPTGEMANRQSTIPALGAASAALLHSTSSPFTAMPGARNVETFSP